MNNKWIGQAVMYAAETMQALAPEQYSSQNHKATNTKV